MRLKTPPTGSPKATRGGSHLQEVVQVLEDPDAHLVQVLQETVEDGHQVGGRELVTEDHRQLVDGEGQRPTHLPLRAGDHPDISIQNMDQGYFHKPPFSLTSSDAI